MRHPQVENANGLTIYGTPSAGQVVTATNAIQASWQDPTGGGGGASALTQTATQTSAYTASPNQLVITDVSAGTFIVTLPTAPANKTIIAVKKIDATPTAVTITCGGSDVFITSGLATATLTLPGQAITYQYNTAIAKWTGISNDVDLATATTANSTLQNLYVNNTTSDVTIQAKVTGGTRGAYLVVDSTHDSFHGIQGKVATVGKWLVGRSGDNIGLNFYTNFIRGASLDDNQSFVTYKSRKIQRAGKSANYSIVRGDELIAFSTLASPKTVTLPDATTVSTNVSVILFEIKDETGNAATSNITIVTVSSQLIDGASTYVINTAYGHVSLYSNGTNWFTR